jgi:nitronate monooxygenase
VSLPDDLRQRLRLPLVCPPMFLVSGPDLVIAARAAGLLGALPVANARSADVLRSWLERISAAATASCGPLAVNIATRLPTDELATLLELCRAHGAELVITAAGKPDAVVGPVHDAGMLVLHDVTNLRFAEKAVAAGVDGLVCIGAGGGGHSGVLSHLAFIPRVREMFDGIVVGAGAIAHGAAVRAVEVLGADLAYAGTRFIATQESMAADDYKQMLVDAGSNDLGYLRSAGGAPANWLRASLERNGVDVDAVAETHGDLRVGVLPGDLRLWADVWSGGQGVDLIHDVPPVAELVDRMAGEYHRACALPAFPARHDVAAGRREPG